MSTPLKFYHSALDVYPVERPRFPKDRWSITVVVVPRPTFHRDKVYVIISQARHDRWLFIATQPLPTSSFRRAKKFPIEKKILLFNGKCQSKLRGLPPSLGTILTKAWKQLYFPFSINQERAGWFNRRILFQNWWEPKWRHNIMKLVGEFVNVQCHAEKSFDSGKMMLAFHFHHWQRGKEGIKWAFYRIKPTALSFN